MNFVRPSLILTTDVFLKNALLQIDPNSLRLSRSRFCELGNERTITYEHYIYIKIPFIFEKSSATYHI